MRALRDTSAILIMKLSCRGIAQLNLNDLKAADDSMTVSLRYLHDDETSDLQKRIQAAMPKAN